LSSEVGQRVDKWLWYARIAKSRSLAAKLIEEGCVRVNRQRVVKASSTVKPGDVLTATLFGQVRVLEVLAMGERRGPASKARTLYAERLSTVTAPFREPPQEP
jgi:ribosome-associated heat shock protein Hsp15